jgi:hypothetical protein
MGCSYTNPRFDAQLLFIPLVSGFSSTDRTDRMRSVQTGTRLPSTELGYHNLAIEVPNNHQAAVLAWARRETETIPNFFANPNGDGRGNAQLLALTRIAVAPPFRWQIICFDESESILEERARVALTQKKQTEKAKGSELKVDDEMFAQWRERDATIEYYSGGYFNEGKVQSIRKRPLEHAVVRSAGQSGCSLELSLPVATPATFVSEKPGSRDGQVAKSQAGGDR